MFKQSLHIVLFITFISATTQAAQFSDNVIKIGVITDLTGSFASNTGPAIVFAMNMAVEDFNATQKDIKVETLFADHQNKPEIAAEIARRWYDKEKVDAIMDVTASSTALAVNEVAREKKKLLFISSAYTSDLTGKACSPYTIHWGYDTWVAAHSVASVITLTGATTWGLLTVDRNFGHTLKNDTETAIAKAGGRVVENIMHPFGAPDFKPFLKKLKASKAKTIGLLNAGEDMANAIAQGIELGIGKSDQRFAVMLLSMPNLHKLGLEKTQGLLVPLSFYWDSNPKIRTWSKRFFEQQKQMPGQPQAGVYSSVLYYLQTIKAVQSDDTETVITKMRATPIDDPLFGPGRIRQNGRKTHNMYVYEVKAPSDSRYPWDYYRQIALVPAETAFRPEKESGCPLIK